MKKKLTTTLLIGFVSLVAGLILAGIGFFSGGYQQLVTLSAPKQIEKTYSNLHSLSIQTHQRSVEIVESQDQDFHVYYTLSNNGRTPHLTITDKDGLLTISEERETSTVIRGIMQFLGEEVSDHRGDRYQLRIEVPSGKTLDTVQIINHTWVQPAYLTGIRVKDLQISAAFTLHHVTADKASLDASYQFAQISKSRLKEAALTGSDYRLVLEDTQLETSSIANYSQLNSKNLTLLGDNVFSPATAVGWGVSTTQLDLSKESRTNLQLDLSTRLDKDMLHQAYGGYDDSEASDKVGIFTTDAYKHLPIQTETDTHRLSLEKPGSKNKLHIDAVNAHIFLGSK